MDGYDMKKEKREGKRGREKEGGKKREGGRRVRVY